MPEPSQPARVIRNTPDVIPCRNQGTSSAGATARAAALPRLARPLDPAVASAIEALARAAARADARRR
jgi:hypothetical protein